MLFQASPWLRRSWQARRKPRRYKTAKHTVFATLRKAASAALAPLLGCQRVHRRVPAPRPSGGFGGKDRKLCVVRRLPNRAGLFARKLAPESGAPIRSPDPSREWFEAARQRGCTASQGTAAIRNWY